MTENGGEGEKRRLLHLVGTGWLLSLFAYEVTNSPFMFLLKDGLHLNETRLAAFMAMANIPIYIKPLAGLLCDSFPLFGVRRKSYLLLGLVIAALLGLVLGLSPHHYANLLGIYLVFNCFIVLISTALGGLMVDVGQRYGVMGKVSAQRVGANRLQSLIAGPLGLSLAKYPFLWAMGLSALFHLILASLVGFRLREAPTTPRTDTPLAVLGQQSKTLFKSGTLWSAAGLIVLVVASPGFGTPLLYYQTDTLKFSKDFLALLALLSSLGGLAGATFYALVCPRFSLRQLLIMSIVVHAVSTLFYLAYRTPGAALVITAIEGVTQTLALLPLYDLAARSTPKGIEALGYSLMMSVWNLTGALSNLSGSWLHNAFGLTIMQLVWVNAGTTAVVLLFVPLLPAALVDGNKTKLSPRQGSEG